MHEELRLPSKVHQHLGRRPTDKFLRVRHVRHKLREFRMTEPKPQLSQRDGLELVQRTDAGMVSLADEGRAQAVLLGCV